MQCGIDFFGEAILRQRPRCWTKCGKKLPNSQPKVYSALVSVNFNGLTLDIGFGWMLALVCLFLCWRTSSSSCYTCFTNPSVLRYAVSREHLIFSCWVWVPAKFSRHHFFKLIFSENVQQCYYCCFLTVCLENSHFIVFLQENDQSDVGVSTSLVCFLLVYFRFLFSCSLDRYHSKQRICVWGTSRDNRRWFHSWNAEDSAGKRGKEEL